MSTFPLVISFYTKDTYYQWEVQNLIASCQQFGIEHHVEGITSFGSWELNCAYKPFYIHQMIQRFQRPVFWLDADAVFVRKPTCLSVFAESDFSVRINADLPVSHPSYVMSGSLFINDSPAAEKIIRLWAEECRKQITDPERKEEFWDQTALRDILLKEKGLRIGNLPKEYVKIAGHHLDEMEVKGAVIEHHQASRRFKKFINNPSMEISPNSIQDSV